MEESTSHSMKAGARAELLPCPFCGGTKLLFDAVYNTGGNLRYVWCQDCKAHGPWFNSFGKPKQTEQWNRRSHPRGEQGTNEHAFLLGLLDYIRENVFRSAFIEVVEEITGRVRKRLEGLATAPTPPTSEQPPAETGDVTAAFNEGYTLGYETAYQDCSTSGGHRKTIVELEQERLNDWNNSETRDSLISSLTATPKATRIPAEGEVRPPAQTEATTRGICPKCNLPFTNLPEHLTLHRETPNGETLTAQGAATCKGLEAALRAALVAIDAEYEKQHEDCQKAAKSFGEQDDEYGRNFYDGRASGLVAFDIILGPLKKLAQSSVSQSTPGNSHATSVPAKPNDPSSSPERR